VKRKQPTLREKIAACLIELKLVDREWAKKKTAQEICDCVQWDHFPVPVALGGTNHPTNLQPLTIAAHQIKTDTYDKPTISKCKRINEAHEAFRKRVLAPSEEYPRLNKQVGRPRSKYKRTFRGKTVLRDEGNPS